MASAARIAANRAASRLSTGPRTPEGKAAVAQNRLAHGLASSNATVLAHEDPARYAALLDSIRAEYLPSTSTEDFLVGEIARSQWKLRPGTTDR